MRYAEDSASPQHMLLFEYTENPRHVIVFEFVSDARDVACVDAAAS